MPTPPCDVARFWAIGLSLALCLTVPQTWAQAAEASAAGAPVGSLQRTAAAIDDSVDVYRLALIELVPALQLVHEAGQKPFALPTSLVPPLTHEALSRLSASTQRRISTEALAALPRAYHIEVVDALEALAAAENLGQVRLPARALVRALGQQAQLAADVVDVFSRERPIVAEVLGPEAALDTINDALGQLGLAEANIGTIRARKGTPGEQLQAFLRLEIALGRALDLIAAAEESGVHLGFEMPRSTVGLAIHLQQLKMRLAALEFVVEAMEHVPVVVAADVQAEVHTAASANLASELVLRWTPLPAGANAPALLRLYQGFNAEAQRRQSIDAGLCAGLGRSEAEALAGRQAAPAASAAAPTEMASGRSGIKLPWDAGTEAQTGAGVRQYRLASVSAFGVEHFGPWAQVLQLPAHLAAPSGVSATLSDSAYDSALFYHAAGSVTVSWQLSPSDVAERPRAQALAAAQHTPRVAHYAVFRLGGAAPEAIGLVPPGVARFVDRPPLALLAQGVHYEVVALDSANGSARAPLACGQSAEVHADVAGPLRLAAAGAQMLSRPNGYERALAASLARPKALPAARKQFAALPKAEQSLLWQRYWVQTPMVARVLWHELWVQHMSPAQRSALWRQLPKPVAKRDIGLVHAGLWAQQNPDYAGEPQRFFGLLTQEAQRLATSAWRGNMGPEVARAFDAAGAGPDAALKQAWQAALAAGVWFDSRDPEEQTRLLAALDLLDASSRQALESRYWAALPEPLKHGIAWPVWESLTPDERDTYLNTPPDIAEADALAEGLWPGFLAYVAFERLEEAAKIDAIAHDAGFFGRALSQLRYALRPLDVRLGFKLWLYAGLVALGFINGVMLRLLSRQLLRRKL